MCTEIAVWCAVGDGSSGMVSEEGEKQGEDEGDWQEGRGEVGREGKNEG